MGLTQEAHLKRQSLECLVEVLQSLVSWAARGTAVAPAGDHTRPRSESLVSPAITGLRGSEENSSETDLNASTSSQSVAMGNGSGSVTPETFVGSSDEPSRFENAKQRKTTLLEGIKKFNFKPKRVRVSLPLPRH